MIEPVVLSFVVRGDPVSQGSKSAAAVRRKGGNGEWEYTGQTTMREGRTGVAKQRFKSWREAVKEAAADAMSRAPGYYFPLEGPLSMRVVFSMQRPRGHYLPVNGRRDTPAVRLGAPGRPHVKPDLDKLLRAVLDSITQSGAWNDDAQVVELARLAKVYTVSDREALAFPGVMVSISRWKPVYPLDSAQRLL